MIITLIWQSNFYLLDQFCLESLESMASLGKFMAVLCKTFESQKTQVAANHSRGFFGGATFYLKQGKPISEKIEKRGFDQICTAEHF